MRNQTELMKAILTNKTAQRIIDYVAPVYGASYVCLWIYQAIGVVLGEVCDICEQMRNETIAASADLLLDLWEQRYGLATDSTLTKEQRRALLIARMQTRAPANPARLASTISAALGGVEVEITENVAQNTFLVNIREYFESITPAVAIIERMKPAHLVYQIRVSNHTITDADLRVAIAMTHAEQYKVEVQQ